MRLLGKTWLAIFIAANYFGSAKSSRTSDQVSRGLPAPRRSTRGQICLCTFSGVPHFACAHRCGELRCASFIDADRIWHDELCENIIIKSLGWWAAHCYSSAKPINLHPPIHPQSEFAGRFCGISVLSQGRRLN